MVNKVLIGLALGAIVTLLTCSSSWAWLYVSPEQYSRIIGNSPNVSFLPTGDEYYEGYIAVVSSNVLNVSPYFVLAPDPNRMMETGFNEFDWQTSAQITSAPVQIDYVNKTGKFFLNRDMTQSGFDCWIEPVDLVNIDAPPPPPPPPPPQGVTPVQSGVAGVASAVLVWAALIGLGLKGR